MEDNDELLLGTAPNKADTDGDGVSDDAEIARGTDPLVSNHFSGSDSDNDGFNDLEEILLGTDPNNTNDPLGGGSGTPGGGENGGWGGDGSLVGDGGVGGHAPSPPNPPPPPPPFPAADHRVLVRGTAASHVKYGHDTFETTTPPRRYLIKTLKQTVEDKDECVESGPLDTIGKKTITIDANTGAATPSGDMFVGEGGDPINPTMRLGQVVLVDDYDDPPNLEIDCAIQLYRTGLLVKDSENTTAKLKTDTLAKLPAYPTEGPDGGFRSDIAPYAYRILASDELGYAYQRMEVKFAWPEDTPDEAKHPVTYLVIFHPLDNPATTEIDESTHTQALAAWTWDGSGDDSPTWTLDPDTLLPGDRSGTFQLSPLRLYADPGAIHHGFDPPDPSEPGDDLSEYWASVVQYRPANPDPSTNPPPSPAPSTNNILNLDVSTAAASALEWKIVAGDEHADLEEKTFTGPTKLTLKGKNTGATEPKTATINLVPKGASTDGPVFLTLNVWVLPPREMKLAIYTVEDPDAPLTQFGSDPAVAVPSDTEILTVCNDSFRQTGVHFTLHPNRGDRAISLRLPRFDGHVLGPNKGNNDDQEERSRGNAPAV